MLFDDHHIGKCFELYGEYSESEVAAMRSIVRPGDTVLDIGANIGDLTVPLAQMVGPSGHVYAVESHADIFNILCANLALNQISNVRPINAFVKMSEQAPILEQFVKKDLDYTVMTIDDLDLKACRLIKIDVDGNERDVLQSGLATISRLRPILYLENDIQEKSEELLKFLMSLNYALYWHVAPIFSEDNFLGNRVNHWSPGFVVSLMVLAVPEEQNITIAGLTKIKDPSAWVLTGQLLQK